VGERRPVPGGVRLRATIAAIAVVGVALAFVAVAILAFVQRSLSAQISDTAVLRAEQVARTYRGGATVEVPDLTEEFVQLLDGAGTVIAASPNVAGLAPIAHAAPGEDAARTEDVPAAPGPFLVASARAPDGPASLAIVGVNADDVVETSRVVTKALLVGGPILLGVVAIVTWWLTGRALRPVEDLRSEVDRIGTEQLDRRLAVPATGDEIERLGQTMNRMLDRVERGQAEQRRFVADASHELRSPVAALRQDAEVAALHPATTTLAELAEAVLAEVERLQGLVDDLLVLAASDEGAGAARHEVDVDDLLLAEAARLRAVPALPVDTSAIGPARVLGDRAQLERIVRNLTDNAARHARGRLALGSSQADGRVAFWVEDDGPGIAPENRDLATERFVRLDDARARDDGGSGLGLSIVVRLAARHGGSLALGDASLGGLRAEVVLPAATRERT
jgi:signal transduction histidine kinase